MSALHKIPYLSLSSTAKRDLRASLLDPSVLTHRFVRSSWSYNIGMGLLVVFVLLFLIGFANDGFGDLESIAGWQEPPALLGYAVCTGLIAYALFSIWRRRQLTRLFGFPPGRYWLSFSMIDARTSTLKIYDLTKVTSFNITTHTTNGVYTQTAFKLGLAETKALSLSVQNRKLGDALPARWNALKDATRQAFEKGDSARQVALDPLWALRKAGWTVPPVVSNGATQRGSGIMSSKFGAAIVIAVAALLALPIWFIRNVESDKVMYQMAQRLQTEAAYRAYISHGWRHVSDATEALPRVAFEEQRGRHSITGLRGVQLRFPHAGLGDDIAAEIHKLYQTALQKFTAAAPTTDPSLVPLMATLLDYLEATKSPTVDVTFDRPSTTALVEMDRSLSAKGGSFKGRSMAPVAGYFTQTTAAAREARIVSELQHGFQTIFPNDVFAIRPVSVIDASRPSIEIKYEIAPSGSVYFPDDDPTKAFVGLTFHFDASMRVPNQADGWQFGLEVQPPGHFVVEYKKRTDEPKAQPADSQVYFVMGERAFDELSLKMRAAFFKEVPPARKASPSKNTA